MIHEIDQVAKLWVFSKRPPPLTPYDNEHPTPHPLYSACKPLRFHSLDSTNSTYTRPRAAPITVAGIHISLPHPDVVSGLIAHSYIDS